MCAFEMDALCEVSGSQRKTMIGLVTCLIWSPSLFIR